MFCEVNDDVETIVRKSCSSDPVESDKYLTIYESVNRA